MQQLTRRPAAMRAVIVVLLLTGLGLWQAWQCSDAMMASPVAGMPSMSHSTPHGDATAMADDGDSGPGMPAGLAGLCITVLVSIAAAVMLITSPRRLTALLRRVAALVINPVENPAGRAPALAQLCISRT